MPEQVQPEVVVPVIPAVPERHAKRSDIITVTPETFGKYVDTKMGIAPADPLEAEAAKELKEIESKQEADAAEKKAADDPTHDVTELPEEKKKGINERFSKLSTAKREAEEKANKAIAEAKESSEKASRLEAEAAALRDKYEPKKNEQDPKPKPEQFTDITEYSQALEEWSADNAIRKREIEAKDHQAKVDREQVTKNWQERQEAVKGKVEDYAQTIAESPVVVSDQIRDAILESDVGPQVLYHLAKNPEVAEKLGKLTITKALIEFGKIESSVAGEQPQKQVTKVAEISKAPAPISPIKSGAGVESNKIGADGEFHGTYDDWKRLRRAGKIN